MDRSAAVSSPVSLERCAITFSYTAARRFTIDSGQSFVTIAFQAARKADPAAVLYINDYNLDSANAKVRGLVSLVNRVNQANPGTIDGAGTQMHLQVRYNVICLHSFRSF
jgi:GH35 family endo-1,4-beta-xylanase